MLEATIHDGPQQLRLEEEVAKAGRVDGNVAPFHLLFSGVLCPARVVLSRRFSGILLLVIVQQIRRVINVVVCHLFLLLDRQTHTEGQQREGERKMTDHVTRMRKMSRVVKQY